MYIEVPTTKRRVNSFDCAKKALAVHMGKKKILFTEVNTDKYDIEVDEQYSYYPYWIGSVWTIKDRALAIYPAKEIVFYVVTDAIEGSFIVLRNVPKTDFVECTEDKLLPAQITENKLMGDILNEAIYERINKQFIFGAPQSKKQKGYMIYLPMLKVKVKRKEEASHREYFVNIYTGEVKALICN